MENENKKYNAVIRICSHKIQLIKERGFVNVDDAENMMYFLDNMVDELEIFYGADWYGGMDMPEIDAEYWFGKRETE